MSKIVSRPTLEKKARKKDGGEWRVLYLVAEGIQGWSMEPNQQYICMIVLSSSPMTEQELGRSPHHL